MKTIFTLTIIFFSISTYGQLPVLSTTPLAGDPLTDSNYKKYGNYAIDTNNERDQYVGLWRYETPEILFEVKIIKKDQNLYKLQNNSGFVEYYYYIDALIIKYKLVKNGNVIFDNLNDSSLENQESEVIKQGANTFANGSFLDVTRQVNASLSITKLNTIPEKILFDVSSGIYRLEGPDEMYQPGVKLFDIPIDGVEMIRVN